MTEAEWLHGGRADAILEYARDRMTERQMRLVGCACCRQKWGALPDTCRTAVEVAERYADGESDTGELASAYLKCSGRMNRTARECSYVARQTAWEATRATRVAKSAARCLIIRDILGNPFRPARVAGSWLRWNDGTIPKIAQGIYEDRAFDRLPILHDALLDAGCDDEDILSHCRGAGPHVRGCWVIDAILGKS
jgi:hypothetical protein